MTNLSLITNKNVMKLLETTSNSKHRTNRKHGQHKKRKNCFLKEKVENAD